MTIRVTSLAAALAVALAAPALADDDTLIEDVNEAIVDEGDLSGAYGVDRPALGEQGEGLLVDEDDDGETAEITPAEPEDEGDYAVDEPPPLRQDDSDEPVE